MKNKVHKNAVKKREAETNVKVCARCGSSIREMGGAIVQKIINIKKKIICNIIRDCTTCCTMGSSSAATKQKFKNKILIKLK